MTVGADDPNAAVTNVSFISELPVANSVAPTVTLYPTTAPAAGAIQIWTPLKEAPTVPYQEPMPVSIPLVPTTTTTTPGTVSPVGYFVNGEPINIEVPGPVKGEPIIIDSELGPHIVFRNPA